MEKTLDPGIAQDKNCGKVYSIELEVKQFIFCMNELYH